MLMIVYQEKVKDKTVYCEQDIYINIDPILMRKCKLRKSIYGREHRMYIYVSLLIIYYPGPQSLKK